MRTWPPDFYRRIRIRITRAIATFHKRHLEALAGLARFYRDEPSLNDQMARVGTARVGNITFSIAVN